MILNINIDIDFYSIRNKNNEKFGNRDINIVDEVNNMITKYIESNNVFRLAEVDSKIDNILRDSKNNKAGIIQAKIKNRQTDTLDNIIAKAKRKFNTEN
tara:strand:+ start:2471 stop:2767 length:297 start_codon:yes stop_codon:yes gene_type:complete